MSGTFFPQRIDIPDDTVHDESRFAPHPLQEGINHFPGMLGSEMILSGCRNPPRLPVRA
ncbi:MAG: hypothetical protein R3C11_27345 [Planctomycetaceae bacterium]